jgi:F0F1-type ATP synthase epsilon subunit
MTVYKANPRTLSTSWERKLAVRAERAEVKALEAQVKAKRAEIGQKLKEKRLAKEKRKAENALKSSKVQVITKTDKIKKMNKKQLRSVLKTQMDQDGNVRYVPLYGGAR